MGQSEREREKAVDKGTEENQYEVSGNEDEEAVEDKGAGIPPGSGGKDSDTNQTPPA